MTVTDIVTRPTEALRFYDDREQIDLLKRTICRDATDDEFTMFLGVCKRRGLDPFTKQIYFRLYKKPSGERQVTIITGIDAYRLIAERTGHYEGQTTPQWCGDDGKWVDIWLSSKFPVAARVGVWRSKFREPMWGVARWAEYFPQREAEQFMWKKMPSSQLAKCAEAIGLRKAFPEDLSGLYVQEEMDQAKGAVEAEYEHPADVDARASYRAAVQDSPGATATKPASPPTHAAPSSTAPPRGVTSDPKGAASSTKSVTSVSGSSTVTTPAGSAAPRSAMGTASASQQGAAVVGSDSRPQYTDHDPPSPAGKPRTSGAADIKHDGRMATSEQVKLIHVLRAKIPTLAATPDDPRSKWRQLLQVYRRQDGSRCEHSNELSTTGASHLIDRLQAKVDELEAAEREIRSKESPAVPADDIIAPASFVDQLQGIFQGVQEDHDGWLASIGYESTDDVPEASRLPVLQLAAAMKRDAPTYTVWLARAIDQGHIRQIPPRGAL